MRKIIFLFTFIFTVFYGKSQLITLLDNLPGKQTVVTCDSLFLDDGGDGDPMNTNLWYAPNVNDTITFVPDYTGKKVRFIVNSFNIAIGDVLCVYDGCSATSSNLIGCYGQDVTGMQLSQGDTIQPSTYNESGCLTFVFISDNDNKEESGWNFKVSCFVPCQDIVASGTFNTLAPDEQIIKICRNDIVNLTAFGIYPDMGTPKQLYTQNNTLSTFTWYISGPAGSSSEVTEGGTYNPTTGFSEGTHTFADSGIYHIRLEIKDTLSEFECKNKNFIHNIVYVSGPPVFTNVNPVLNDTTRPIFPIICLGDTNYLIGVVDTVFHIDSCTPNTSEMKKIPDGQEEGGLRTVEIGGDFKCYGKEIIDEITDVESFTFDMEHSAIGDLEIILSCPSGNTVVLNSPSSCFSNVGTDNNGAGVVSTYSFNMTSLQTLQQAAQNNGACNSSYFIPAGSYLPEQSFANFIGCPINGTWTLSIKDTKINDNGNAGNWLITFGSTVQEVSDSTFYNVYLDSNWVEEPGNPSTNIHFTSLSKGDTLGLFPTQAGTYKYKFEVIDDFGCTYDTVVEFLVKERKQADFTYPGPFEFCEDDPSTISPVFIPGFMNIMGESGTWTSNPPGLNISPTGVITIAGSTPGIYTIQNEVVTPLTLCVDIHTFTDTIIIHPKPNPSILGAGNYCTTDTLSISSGVGDAPYTSYSWSDGSINDTLFAVQAMNPITVTVTDTNSCQATSQPVSVTSLAQASSSQTITICKGSSVLIHGVMQSEEGVYTQLFNTGQTSCDSVSTITLQFYTPVNLGPDVSICEGSSTTLTAGGVDPLTSNFTWSNSMFGSSITVNPIINTEYRVVATDINGCVTTDTINVIVNPIRDINLTYSQGTVCVNSASPIPTFNNFIGYFFTSNPVGIDAGSGLLSSTQLATPGTYEITYTDGIYQCNINNVATIVVTALPDATFSYGTICVPGTTACPIFNGSASAGLFSLDPSSQTGIVFSPSTGCIDLTASQAGVYTIKNTIPASGVCPIAEFTLPVTINNKPVVSGSTSNNNFCVGGSTILTGSATGNIGAMNYIWDNGVFDNLAFNPTSSLTYTVTGTDGSTGCSNFAIVSVIVNPLPVIDPMTNPTICLGSCTDIEATTPYNPNGNLISFAWDNGLGAGGLKNVCPLSTTVYTVTALNNVTLCQNTAQVTVNVNQPTLDAGADQSICIGGTAQLCASGAVDYSWTPAIGLDNTNSQCVNSTVSNTVTYTVTGTDVNGCTNSDMITLTVNPLPIITATATPNVLCAGLPTTVNLSGANTYTVDGVNIVGTSTTVNAVNSGSSPIVQNILIVGTDINSCVNNFTLPITVNPLPSIDAGNNQVVCSGDEVSVFAQGPYAITWSPALPGGAGNGESFTATSTQTYTANAIDVNGCQGTDQVTIAVNPNPTVIASASDLTPCEGDVITLSGSGLANGTYLWSNGVTNATPFNVTGVSNTYVVTGIDANGCMDTNSVTITVNANPQVIVQANDYEICIGNEVVISATEGFTNYAWTPSGTGQTFTDTPGQTTTYTVIVTDVNGCTATSGTSVTVVPNNVLASFTPDSLQGYPGLTVDFVNNSQNATNYTWNFGNGTPEINTDIKGNQTSEYNTEGQYNVYLIATNSNTGCTDDTTIIITVIPFDGAIACPPNIFTPNNDGENDYFYVDICKGLIEKLDVVVYNRWGNEIHSFGGLFDPNDPNTYWDGTKDGKNVSEGVYFYKYEIVSKNGDVVKGHDNIHLIRNK